MPADHRADVFALGVLLYKMLTGQRAFQRPSTAETQAAVLRDDPPPAPPGRPSPPPWTGWSPVSQGHRRRARTAASAGI